MLFRQSSTVAPALLALADGTVFQGQSIGANGLSVGEVVFNTAMTGYQEILTDPSYSRQIVTLTYPHIGNVGMNADDAESTSIHAAGLVIRDLPQVVSNFRSQQNLADALKAAGIVGIAGIDTRRLTRILREKGAQNGALLAGQVGESLNAQSAIDAAKKFPGLKGMDLAKVVTTPKAYRWAQGSWRLGQEGADGPAVSTEKISCCRARLRCKAQHPADVGRPRLCGVGGSRPDNVYRNRGARTRWRLSLERPRRSRAL